MFVALQRRRILGNPAVPIANTLSRGDSGVATIRVDLVFEKSQNYSASNFSLENYSGLVMLVFLRDKPRE